MSPPGITFLDHTADVGFDVRARSADGAFHAAAVAMLALLRGEDDVGDVGDTPPAAADHSRTLELGAPDPARLLADWLRELLFLHEIDALDYEAAVFSVLDLEPPCRLGARVRLRAGGHAVREIKGVTYHAMHLRPAATGWEARVIFDV